MKLGALAVLAIVLAVVPCSGQPLRTEDLYPGCGCSGDNSKLGESGARKHMQAVIDPDPRLFS